jgi:septal ring factor EnvC (AmiA/AmiB activator)
MEKYQNYFTIATLTLCLFIFLRTCGTASELSRIEKDIESLNKKVNQMDSTSIKSNEMVKIIKETPNWKTLEIEELSDKNKVPVNYYKNMDK